MTAKAERSNDTGGSLDVSTVRPSWAYVPLGRPRPLVAIILRCISDAPTLMGSLSIRPVTHSIDLTLPRK